MSELNAKETYLNENNRFKKGNPGGGRPKETEATKLKRKATKEYIAEYKEKLGESLPLVSPILIAKAMEGDMQAIKEVNDRVMGKAQQSTDITSGGEALTAAINIIQPNGDNVQAK